MRYIVLALALVGCGSSLPTDTTTWTAQLGAWETPTCEGSMTLTSQSDPALHVGTWKCGDFGGFANAEIRDDGRVFLNLETKPGFLNGVRGTLEADDAIAGDILMPDGLTRFAAYRQ